ncbi:hypothetical protein D3C74_166090 [compost metagenome]
MNYYICPVCGFDKLEDEPYIGGIDSNAGSYEICPCCGFQFGYNQKSKITQFRKEWIINGSKWFDGEEKPKEWCLEEQLKRIGSEIAD